MFFCLEGADMRALKNKILTEGRICEGGVLKVGSFLNQQLDVEFLFKMGEHIAQLYKDAGVTRVLTIESSGIAIAVPAAHYLGVNVSFVKKSRSSNMSDDCYSAKGHSFTHGDDYNAVISKEYILPTDRVLIVDDFLAEGNAVNAMVDIVNQSGAEVVGCAIAIEKAFQGGGDKLRAQGYRVESLALIESMADDGITFGTR